MTEISITIPEGIPEERLGHLKAFLVRYANAAAEDFAEHGVADATGYPSEPKAYGGCTIEDEKEN